MVSNLHQLLLPMTTRNKFNGQTHLITRDVNCLYNPPIISHCPRMKNQVCLRRWLWGNYILCQGRRKVDGGWGFWGRFWFYSCKNWGIFHFPSMKSQVCVRRWLWGKSLYFEQGRRKVWKSGVPEGGGGANFGLKLITHNFVFFIVNYKV